MTMADIPMDDAPLQDGTDNEPPFSDQEKELLDMYDQIQKLELEVALTKARVRLAEGNPSTPDTPQATESARADLLSATALHHLRQTVTTNVLITNPLLKAIHASTLASPIEQDLPPSIAARDSAAQAVAEQAAALRQTLDALSQVEADARRATARNRALAAEVLQLAAAAAGQREVVEDEGEGGGGQRAKIAELERQLATSRYRWRVFKGAASGIVAGSGVQWAEDEDLAAVVLDPE